MRRRDDCDYGSWERALFVVDAVMSISDSVNGVVGSWGKRLIISGKRMNSIKGYSSQVVSRCFERR